MKRPAPDDIDDLSRFLTAQEGLYEQARAEIEAGAKRGHWMWFVFPQLRGLGHSPTAYYYGLSDLDEARRYLGDPVLGARLVHCARAVLGHRDRTAAAIFGEIDAIKLRSSATLFGAVPGAPDAFAQVIAAFFDGRRCPHTEGRLA